MTAAPWTARVRWVAVAGLAAAAWLAWAAPADAQCAMCRTALDSPEGRLMIAALRSGILLLLSAPFAAFGLVAYFAVRSQRRLEDHGKSARRL